MYIRPAICATVFLLAAPLAAPAATLKAKSGAWEITTTSTTAGNLVPAEALAKMPPDQRAKLEAAMRASAGKPATNVSKSCVTQEDLDQNRMLKPEEEDCTRKIIASSATKVVMDQNCPAPQASTSRVTIEAPSPDRLVATMDMTLASAGKVHVEIKGRWLAASCAGTEDE